MGKASRWFKGLLGFKKDKETVDKREKRRWSFGKPTKESSSPVAVAVAVASHDTNPYMRPYMTENEQNKHAIAVAAATAAAADAAVAAAQAAVAVVKLTSHGRERWAAVKIQTVFRAHLARKALRALKGLVKLQALVRGFLVRRRTVATLYSMQALVRAQAAVRSQRARRSFKDRHRKPTERYDHETRSEIHSKRLSTSYESTTNSYDYESPKIVEIDTYKTHARSRRIHTCQTDSSEESRLYHNMSSPNPERNIQDSEWGFVGGDHEYKCSNTTQSTPRFGRTNNGSATPAKSVCGDSFFRSYYSNHPSYMANTQSFRAKQRSHSAPKQRPEVGAKKRLSLIEIMASRSSLSGVKMQRSCSRAQQVINEL